MEEMQKIKDHLNLTSKLYTDSFPKLEDDLDSDCQIPLHLPESNLDDDDDENLLTSIHDSVKRKLFEIEGDLHRWREYHLKHTKKRTCLDELIDHILTCKTSLPKIS